MQCPSRHEGRVSSAAAALLAVALVGACGGRTSTSSECSGDAPLPCGGDLRGKWAIVSVCPTGDSQSGQGCGFQTTVRAASADATYDFRADGTVVVSVHERSSIHIATPSTCSEAARCPAAALGLSDELALCSEATTGCVCDVSLDRTISETRTYSAAGTTLTLMQPGGLASLVTFCAQGTELTLMNGQTVVRATKL